MGVSFVALGALTLAASQAHAWWKPSSGTTWQIVLSEPLSASDLSQSAAAFDFDLFDNPASTVQQIHNNGRHAICYFSAGSYEKWRPDAKQFNASDLGKPLDGWPGERWVNTNSANVRRIMQERMDLAVSKGCDAIDPDNMDCYDNGGGGFGLTKADATDYMQFLAAEGHKRGLAVGLKNAGAIIPKVLSDVDFSVNEQCLQYNECSTFQPFIGQGKPVFHIEYVKGTPPNKKVQSTCSNPSSVNFSTLIKHLNLDDWYVACGQTGSMSGQTGSTNQSRSPPSSRRGSHSAISHKAGNQQGTGSRVLYGSIVPALILAFAFFVVI